jgi:hypothetical protein
MVSRYGTFERMLEFHHVDPDSKHSEYKNLIRQSISSEQLAELDKCILLCRQCHAIVHAQNIAAELEITVNHGPISATQKFNGQLVADKVYRTYSFLTNERFMLNPYHVQIGEQEDNMMFGVDLQNNNFLGSCLRNIRNYKIIKIRSLDGQGLIMRATHIRENLIEVKHSLGFPFMYIELSEEKGLDPYLWIRNGCALHKDGTIITDGLVTYEVRLAS